MSMRTPILVTLALLLTGSALAGQYVGGGTFVVKTEALGTIVDNGGVVCTGTDGSGYGGGCIPFPTNGREGGFVHVFDEVAGYNVAFQVCIDNNGDGVCGGPLQEGCNDQIFFSHDDQGRFFNPLGPLPTSFFPECQASGQSAGGFPGYVVLLCQGAHEVNESSHTHALTRGQIGRASFGSGYGNFCGGGFGGSAGGFGNFAAKAYTIV